MSPTTSALLASLLLLLLSISLLVWRVREDDGTPRQAIMTFAWLCLALAATFALFAFFPETHAEGTAFGISLGGAGVFVIVVLRAVMWVHGRVAEIDRTNDARRAAAPAPVPPPRSDPEPAAMVPETLRETRIHPYPVPGARGRRLCLITGNLRDVTCVDVWVNSENTDMQMSSQFERSISGTIRYEGAKRDESGRITEDLIAQELSAKVRGKTPVTPGVAIVTGPGELAASHHVSFIVHLATVQGEPGEGYHQIGGIDRCVANALRAAAGQNGRNARSIIFPLLGVGSGRGDRTGTARQMVSAAIGYLKQNPDSPICDVYFLARKNITYEVFRDVIENGAGLSPAGAKQRL
ncbi:macro domain-containing protein [Kitasatospora cineracea]|uniref:macro domain-containing protein n=1 Tax=Kitasatospora cineracea TaxID=88074 RepID=UPI0037FF5CB5